MEDHFDPYHKWLGIPPKEQPPNHYQLLGLALFESDPDVIESAADRQMSHVRTFQSGRYSAHSQEVLNVLSSAKVCLLKPQLKAEYDEDLRTKLVAAKPLPQAPAPPIVTTPPTVAPVVPSSGIPIPITPIPQVVPAVVYRQPVRNGIPPSGPPFQPIAAASSPARRKQSMALVRLVTGLVVVLIFVMGWWVYAGLNQVEEQQQTALRDSDEAVPKAVPRTESPASDDTTATIPVRTIDPPKVAPPMPMDNKPPNKMDPPQPVLLLPPPDSSTSKPRQSPEAVVINVPKSPPPPPLPAPQPIEPSPISPPPANVPFDAQQAEAHQAAWAKHLGTQVESKNAVGAKMILIPPGEFLMGSSYEQVREVIKEFGLNLRVQDRIQKERPQHLVKLSQPFRLGQTEVTVGQFQTFVNATKYVTQSEEFGGGNSSETSPKKRNAMTWRAPGYTVTKDSAVTQVTWNDACAFCNWLSAQENIPPSYHSDGKDGWLVVAGGNGYRLPTEAQWEYACRAGTTTQYSFGDDVRQFEQYGWDGPGNPTRTVGLKLPNPLGLHDMHGNVSEWCQDCWDQEWYKKTSLTNPSGPLSTGSRVYRGGNYGLLSGRSAYRLGTLPVERHSNSGFRVAQDLGGGK